MRDKKREREKERIEAREVINVEVEWLMKSYSAGVWKKSWKKEGSGRGGEKIEERNEKRENSE